MYNENGEFKNEAEILEELKKAVENSSGVAAGVGFLTTECRNVWGMAYQELKKGN